MTKKEKVLIDQLIKKERELGQKVRENIKLKKNLASLDAAYQMSRDRKEAIMKVIDWKQSFTNMAVTFLEAAFAYWYATGADTSELAVAGAAGAGISAVWNLVIKPAKRSMEKTI